MSNHEAHALIAALDAAAPDTPTACAGWTVHDLVAHLAAGSEEIADLVEDRLLGRPARPTRGFEEREAPFRALPWEDLRTAWMVHGTRLTEAVAALDARGPTEAVDFTGIPMTSAQLRMHARSEAAIHRWDVCGDDDTSDRLLAQPELTAHAAQVLSAMTVLDESAVRRIAPEPHLRIVLRAAGRPDITLAGGRFALAPDEAPDADAVVETDAAHRLLVMWGRRSPRRPLQITAAPAVREAVDQILWPDLSRRGAA
ncbi:MAG TPA: maleylpyruvate isomerase family mycothiol-dependent enzyme [Iamia sp.]